MYRVQKNQYHIKIEIHAWNKLINNTIPIIPSWKKSKLRKEDYPRLIISYWEAVYQQE